MANRKFLCITYMSEAELEQKYIKETFYTKWVVSLGPQCQWIKMDLEEFCCQEDRLVLSVGMAAVHLGLLTCGIGPGDEDEKYNVETIKSAIVR